MTGFCKYPAAISLLATITFNLSAQTLPVRDNSDRFGLLEELYMPAIRNVRPIFGIRDTISVMVIGDVMMHARQLQYNYNEFLRPIEHLISKADLAVANMEFTLAGEPYSGYPAFSAPDGYARYAARCGIDIFLTANNHILDKGKKGLERTMDIYDRMQEEGLIKYTGISRSKEDEALNYPLIIPLKGIRIALLNFTYGTNSSIREGRPKVNLIDKADIMEALKRAKAKNADYIIALPHWGNEYILKHSDAQEELALWLAENGVDMIVGSHPHVVQDSTVIIAPEGRAVPVFYSVGNAVSNMSATNTRLELAVNIRIVKEPDGSSRMIEPTVKFLWCTLPGKLFDNFGTISVSEYLDRHEEWIDKADYNNMKATYRRVKDATGIKD